MGINKDMRNFILRVSIVLGIFMILSVRMSALPKDVRFRHFSVTDGLSDRHVCCITQDPSGFIWIGTQNGLNRFDGYSFTVFKHNAADSNSLPGNHITCIHIDSGGRIWTGHLKGMVSCYDPRTEKFTRYSCCPSGEKPESDVSGITEGKDGLIWITVDRMGLVRLDPEKGTPDVFRHSDSDQYSLSHNAVTDIIVGPDGKLWITTWGGGLNILDPESMQFRHIPFQADTDYGKLTCLYLDKEGDLWAGSTYVGAIFQKGTDPDRWGEWKEVNDNRGLFSNSIRAMTEDEDGNIWIGTSNGLGIVDKRTLETNNFKADNGRNGLASAVFTALFRDSHGSIWAGTNNGLHLYNKGMLQFNRLSLPDGSFQSGFTFGVLRDREGGLWIKDELDLHYYHKNEPKTERIRKIIYDLTRRSGTALCEDRHGNVWIGTTGDYVAYLNPATGKSAKISLNPADIPDGTHFRNAHGIYEDYDGTIWISTEVGLLAYRPETGTMTPLFRSGELIYPEFKVSAVLRDRLGNLWVGTQGGLKRYGSDLGKVRNYTYGDGSGIIDSQITSLCEDFNGTLWVGTESGLNKYVRERDQFIEVAWHGLPAETPIRDIEDDGTGSLWVATSNGLVRYDYNEDKASIFDEDDGLLSRESISGGITLGPDREFILCTAEGINRFNPDSIIVFDNSPKAVIEEMLIFNDRFIPEGGFCPDGSGRVSGKATLNHKQSTLTFRFAALEYVSPQKILYSYRMDNVDHQWVVTSPGHRTATYANLSPGHYVFRVKAAGNDENWDSGEARMDIIIKPPFFQTILAYVIYALLGISAIIATVAGLSARSRRKNRIEMERLVARQQHEMDEMKFQFFTNISHEFRTSLTLIMGPINYLKKSGSIAADDRPMLDIMQHSSSRLLRLVNQLLDFRKVEEKKMELSPTVQDIVPFLKEEFDTYRYYAQEKNLDYSFICPEESLVFSFDKDKVDKVVYNLLSNAFKYTDTGGHVTLSVEKENAEGKDYVLIRVSDNGSGISEEGMEHIFQRFYQDKTSGKTVGGSGLGLSMTYELVTLMGGQISVESEINKGTQFSVRLPVEYRPDTEGEETAVETGDVAYATEDEGVEETSAETSNGLVLLVEDNPDMRRYLRAILRGKYEVAEACDGQEGLNRILEIRPDIVISDVMMPQMDGFELLSRLKSDERISHIPFILMTAVTDESRMIEGFENGIDDYITKPFSPEVLLARVSNIILRNRTYLEKKAYNENPFISKLIDTIRDNLADATMNVDSIAAAMNLTSAQLTRKSKALMGTTPYILIRKTRMETAIRLLKETDLNISEIAFQCGYQEVSNFSRAFTQYWGNSPSSEMKKHRKTL